MEFCAGRADAEMSGWFEKSACTGAGAAEDWAAVAGDGEEKNRMACGRPSSFNSKSDGARSVMGLPFLSRAMTSTLTRRVDVWSVKPELAALASEDALGGASVGVNCISGVSSVAAPGGVVEEAAAVAV